jgi:hypothetical protein
VISFIVRNAASVIAPLFAPDPRAIQFCDLAAAGSAGRVPLPDARGRRIALANLEKGPQSRDVLLFENDDELPEVADEDEARLATRLGADELAAIDFALVRSARDQWLKAARVVADAMTAGNFPRTDEAYVRLHLRRLIGLVASGLLEAQGGLRRPRFSEVRLPAGGPSP